MARFGGAYRNRIGWIFAGLLAAVSAGEDALAQSAADPSRASTILVFDVSNSMWGQIDGVSKIEIAREVIGDMLKDWDPAVDLGLVAYGHRREGDCSDIESLIPVGPVNAQSFSATVNSLTPRGKTPLTDAVRQSAEILNYRDTPSTVILVSDGIESCNADPCALAQELERGGVNFTAHVIGFDVGRIKDQRQLSCLAETTGGLYLTADNADELTAALKTVAAPPPPPPPTLRLEAAEAETGPALTDGGIRWTVVSLDTEETVIDGQTMASPAMEVGAGRYFARAELGELAGGIEFDYAGDGNLTQRVVLTLAAQATLEAPPTIGAGAEIRIAWDGPDNQNDFVTIAPMGAEDVKHGNYAYTRQGNPAKVRAPDEPGAYELRYVSGQSRNVLGRLPITVTEVGATLEAAPTIGAGAEIQVTWTGPDNQNDFITVVPAGAEEKKNGDYAYTRQGNPVKLRAPDAPGQYELRYLMGQSRESLASLPITVTAVGAMLDAPPTIGAGSAIKVTWTGPDNQNDFITIVPAGADEKKNGNYTYTRKGSPLELRAPDEPGAYELRYLMGQSKETLVSLPITVTAVEAMLEAPPAIGAGADFKISWTGPDNQNDFITIVPAGEDEKKNGNYTYTRKGSPLEVRAPDEPGAYELRYLMGQSKETLVSLPITVTPVTAELDAPPVVSAKEKFKVTWNGPDNRNDFITIVPAGADEKKNGPYTYTRQGSPLTIKAPDKPGSYELRYLMGQSKATLARLPITVR